MEIKQILSAAIKNQLASGISGKINIPEEKSRSVIEYAVTLLLTGLAKNSQDPDEAESISKALYEDHDGSILNDTGANIQDESVKYDGAKILKHILGSRESLTSQVISSKTNIDPSQVDTILKLVAPFVMGALGKMNINANFNANDLSSILQKFASSTDDELNNKIFEQEYPNQNDFFTKIFNFLLKIFKKS